MYNFKFKEEFVWGLIVAGTTVALQALSSFDPATIGDIRTWGVGVSAGIVRALAAAALVGLGKMGAALLDYAQGDWSRYE